MKRILFLLSFALMSVLNMAAQGRVQGSFAPLKGESRVNFDIVFRNIHGMSEADFSAYETDWQKDKPEVVGIFTNDANRTLGDGLTIGHFPDTPYTLKVVVNSVSTKGDYLCDALLLDAQQHEIARIDALKTRGGVWGTKLNLIKQGAESAGKACGKALKAALKKAGK